MNALPARCDCVFTEYTPGMRMADIDPFKLTPEVKEAIMIRVIEADYDVRRAGVHHYDIAPRTVPETLSTAFHLSFVDLSRSIVYKIRFGGPLQWRLCNPLFDWTMPDAWIGEDWLPSFDEGLADRMWQLWGEGKDGKSVKVERDLDHPFGEPIRVRP